MNLDSRPEVTALDPKGMWGYTENYPDQCRVAYGLPLEGELPETNGLTLAMLTGLGGSAVGGDYVKAMFENGGRMPFIVNRDYNLPAYVNSNTLLFCTSYSGNTEETLSAYAEAKSAGARIICVCSGGKLKALAQADGYPVITVPGGQPPRTALGFMLIPVLKLCVQMGLIPEQDFEKAFRLLDRCSAEWTIDGSDGLPKVLASSLKGNLGIIYGLGSWQAIVANRWKGQINENSKNHVFVNAFPELNHNEILAWVKADGQGVSNYVGIILQDGTESAKMKKRAEVTEGLVAELCAFAKVSATGETLLEKMLSLTFLGDFVSLYLAALNHVDPESIDSINILKTELSQIP